MKKKAEALVKRMLEKHQVETVVAVARKLTNNNNHQVLKMERKPGTMSVDIDGRLYIDSRLVDSAMILFEEEAKNLLEKELMEGPLNNYMKDDEDDSFLESDDFDIPLEDSDYDENISFDSGYYDISNDEFDTIN